MEDLVSIIIPTYGGANLLPRAIEGVLIQTHQEFELIIVDDNGKGTDNQLKTASVIEPYLTDNRIEYIVHDVNRNGSAARNTGVSHSKGNYIALLDDDDVYNPDFIEKQLVVLKALPLEYAMVYCSHESYFDGVKIEEYHAEASGNLLYENLIHSIEIATTSALIRRSAFENIGGFDESFRRHQDWEFMARLAAKYLIKANDFLGYKRYLEWRNVPVDAAKALLGYNRILEARKGPVDAEQAKLFRLHYLEKMTPLLNCLSKKQARTVIVYNKLDVALWYLKERRPLKFVKEYIEIKPGLRGLRFMYRRIMLIINRGKMKLV